MSIDENWRSAGVLGYGRLKLPYHPGRRRANRHPYAAVVEVEPMGKETTVGWLWHALAIAGSMSWEILWALILGFALSAVVQAVVRREAVVRALGGNWR